VRAAVARFQRLERRIEGWDGRVRRVPQRSTNVELVARNGTGSTLMTVCGANVELVFSSPTGSTFDPPRPSLHLPYPAAVDARHHDR